MLSDKISIVTGAAGGIGSEISRQLAKEKSTVILVDIDEQKVGQVAREISNEYRNAFGFKVDVSKSKEVDELVDKIIKQFGKIDILINGAGINEGNRLVNTTDEIFDKVININLKGAFYFCRAVAKNMIENRYGKIISLTSISGKTKSVFAGPSYVISKAGLIGLTMSVASQLAEYNVNVNAIACSFVETEMVSSYSKEQKELIRQAIPLKRFSTTDDVAKLVLFLASDNSSFITGETILLSGGSFMD